MNPANVRIMPSTLFRVISCDDDMNCRFLSRDGWNLRISMPWSTGGVTRGMYRDMNVRAFSLRGTTQATRFIIKRAAMLYHNLEGSL